jgi:SAM-dependent methyltransferase
VSRETLKLSPLAAHAIWASTYDLHANPVLLLEERVVEGFLASTGCSTVLDVGCGTGRWLTKFVERGTPAVGLDLSAPMLRQAQRRPGLGGRLVLADCSTIPLRTASVELAISSFCIGYVQDVREFAKELARVVRPNGHVIISDFHPSARGRGWTRSFRHGNTVVEILSSDHGMDCVFDGFAQGGLELVRYAEPRFGDLDRDAFDRCGRRDLFLKVRGEIAIFAGLFRQTRKPFARGVADE